MINYIVPFLLSFFGGYIYSLIFMHTKKFQLSSQKQIINILITIGRITFQGFFLYILLKYWPTHSILIVLSFIISFIMTTMVIQKT